MDETQKARFQQYSINISPVLHQKLDQHIFILKKLLRPGQTKQDWLVEAVLEKLAREAVNNDVAKETRVSFRIDLLTKKKVEERIKMIRRFRYSYSKKQWILDAILEKLGQEEERVKKDLLEYQTAFGKNKPQADL